MAKMKTPAETCGPMPHSGYLGHFAKPENMNRGHNINWPKFRDPNFKNPMDQPKSPEPTKEPEKPAEPKMADYPDSDAGRAAYRRAMEKFMGMR